MIIFCKLCNHGIRSYKPDLEAQREVMEQMGTHLGVAHGQQAQELAMLLAAVTTYLLLKRFVNIPPSETALRQSFEENEKALLENIGLHVDVEFTADEGTKKGPDESGPVN